MKPCSICGGSNGYCICSVNTCLKCGLSIPRCICLSLYGARTYNYAKATFEPKLETAQGKEPLVGYRVWGLDLPDCILRSTYRKEFTWPFRKPLCQDLLKDAGIHAAKSGKAIFTSDDRLQIAASGLWNQYKAQVAGTVYLWGKVTEHDFGYTAEFAYPKELWMPDETDPLTIMQLEYNYGVPVNLHSELHKHKPAPEIVPPTPSAPATPGGLTGADLMAMANQLRNNPMSGFFPALFP